MILGYETQKVQHALARKSKNKKFFSASIRYFKGLLALAMLASCATPTQQLLKQHQWQAESLEINHFQLWLVNNGISKPGTLHIYLSGDGHPWLNKTLIAKDPSPYQPVALQLMSLDPNPAHYLGRPCYHLPPGQSEQAPCEPSLWTFQRYSETVVQTMAQGVRQLGSQVSNITLIGFSGGGVLATLIGERVKKVKTVVSIAANLDTQLWSETLGYSPLQGSINPRSLPALRRDMRRIHLIAGKDSQVPPKVTNAFINTHGGTPLLFAEFNHHCCWHTIWQEFVQKHLN